MELIDIAIAVTLFELLVLAAYHARTGRGIAPLDYLPNVAAGLLLMLGVRAAVSGAGWLWVSAAVGASGIAHLIDLRRRWRG